MKVKLLNDGGYVGMGVVKFPCEVEAELSENGFCFVVPTEELFRIGCDPFMFDFETQWHFRREIHAVEVEE